MTDLTVLISPIPLYPDKNEFSFGRSKQPLSRPIMVTLETEVDTHEQEADNDSESHFYPRMRPRSAVVDPGLLSPPINTWKSRSSPRPPYRYQHRPTRSQSAPPDRRTPIQEEKDQDVKRNSVESLQDALPDRRSLPAFRKSSGLGPGELSVPLLFGAKLVDQVSLLRLTRLPLISFAVQPTSLLGSSSTDLYTIFLHSVWRAGLREFCAKLHLRKRSNHLSPRPGFKGFIDEQELVMTRRTIAMVFSLLPYFSKAKFRPQSLVHATSIIVSSSTPSTLPAFSNPTLSSSNLDITPRSPFPEAPAVFSKRQQGGGLLSLSFAVPAPAPTPSPNPIPNGALIPLLLSPFPTTSTTSSRISTSIPVSSTNVSSTTSSNAGSTASNTQQVHLTPSTFLPFIVLTSCFVLAVMGWCLHGWCTRKPRENFRVKMTKDENGDKFKKRGGRVLRKMNGNGRGRGAGEEELVCGPKYASLTDVEGGHGSERFEYQALGGDPYKWPSLSMSVPVVTSKEQKRVGQYAPQGGYESREDGDKDRYKGDNPFVTHAYASAPLCTNDEWVYKPTRSESKSQQQHHLNLGRKPTLVDTHKRVHTQSKGSRRHPPASSTVIMDSSSSSASPTSVALKELYEGVLMALSASEAAPGVEKDVGTPPVGIGRAFSTGLGSGGKFETHGTSGNETGSGRKRRAYERRGSEADEVGNVDVAFGSKRDWEDRTGRKLEVRNPSVGEGRLGHNGDEAGYEYTPLPTPTRVVHEEREPLFSQLQRQRQTPISKDILPAHPKQIISPPLESQICFVPISAAGVIDSVERQRGIAHSLQA